jgi:hypothetical protein
MQEGEKRETYMRWAAFGEKAMSFEVSALSFLSLFLTDKSIRSYRTVQACLSNLDGREGRSVMSIGMVGFGGENSN